MAERATLTFQRWGGSVPDEILWNLILGRREDRRRRDFARNLWRKYRITAEDYARMFNRQAGLCAICHKRLEDRRGGASVDHNHKTKAIRGILCGYCNKWFLGFVERGGKERLRRAVRYLGWGELTNNHKSRRRKLKTVIWRVA